VNGALTLLASLVMENGARWGEVATPWQWDDARAVLSPGDGDPLLHFLTRPRSGSKTSDLAGMTLAALIEQVPAGGRCYAIASDRDQARLLVDAVTGYVARTPGLGSAITSDRFTASTPTGARLEVVAADVASSYGLRGSLFVVDELTQWPTANQPVWTSIISAVPKVPGARLIVLASAGDPAHFSHRIRERARISPAWRLHEVAGPVPWVDEAALTEQRALLTDSQYARLHLNQWTASEDRLTSVTDLTAAVRLNGPQEYRPGVVYKVGVDLGLTDDKTAIAICHSEVVEAGSRTRRVVLDRLLVFEGSKGNQVKLADVEAVLIEAWRQYGRPRVRIDPWQAAGLAQRLRRQGVSVEEWSYTPRRYGEMAVTLFTLLRDGLLDLYDDPDLIDELANIRLETTLPGLVRMQHDPGRHDDRAVALGFAATALVERPGSLGGFSVARGRIPLPKSASRSTPATGPKIVRDGETPKHPGIRQRFLDAKQHPGYQPPRPR
jgi:phage terminase large subunit-like protein